MGLGIFKISGSSFDPSPAVPNPNPRNFVVQKREHIGKHVVVLVNYPDANNYEGNKILVFKNCTVDELINQRIIDPHFSENKKFHSPFARFEPTDEGWEAACAFVKQFFK